MEKHMSIEYPDPVDERCAERVYASACHVEIRNFLGEPACRDRHNRVFQNAEVLRQR